VPSTPDYDPCADRSCGDPCEECAPDDTDCVEDAAEKQCDLAGRCAVAPADCQPGPCAPVVFEGGRDGCTTPVWFWNGDACAESSSCACVSGECDRVYATAAECLAGNAECIGEIEPEPDPSCAPTTFEGTADDCEETSWLWSGNECVSTTHCGCASGECDRLYEDYRTCETAHVACLPNACREQDAQSGAAMCGNLYGYAFNGYDCEAVICQCQGNDCQDVPSNLEECQSRFERCLARVPTCVADRFPVESTELGFAPVYPEYSFSVEGYDDLYDEPTQTVAVFAEWTAAQALGWEVLPEDPEPERCPFIDGLPLYIFPSPPCPRARVLVLEAGQETFRVHVTLHWEFLTAPFVPANVEVRIVPHPSGTLVLQIRDSATGLPVVMVVQTLPGTRSETPSAESPWELAPFSFTPGERLCFTEPSDCRWRFAPLGLDVSAGGAEQTVEPLHVADVEVDGALFTVLHGYFYGRYESGEHACVAPYSPLQSFALIAGQ
jgi:hypothetical protein